MREPSWTEWATVEVGGTRPTVILDSDETRTARAVAANAAGNVLQGWRVFVQHDGPRITVITTPGPRSNAGPVSLGQYSGSATFMTTLVSHGLSGTPAYIGVGINHVGSNKLTARAYNKNSSTFMIIFMNTDNTSLNGQWLTADWFAVSA